MSYCNDVGVLITVPNSKSIETMVNELKAIKGIKALTKRDGENYLFDTMKCWEEDGEKYIYLGVTNVQWFENDNKSIMAFLELVNWWEDTYEEGGIHYVRIGENLDDIEEVVSGEPMKFIHINRTMSL